MSLREKELIDDFVRLMSKMYSIKDVDGKKKQKRKRN